MPSERRERASWQARRHCNGGAIKRAGKDDEHRQNHRTGAIEGSGIEDALDGIRGGDCHHAGDGEDGAVQDSPKTENPGDGWTTG